MYYHFGYVNVCYCVIHNGILSIISFVLCVDTMLISLRLCVFVVIVFAGNVIILIIILFVVVLLQ